jgi:hypothetical protein
VTRRFNLFRNAANRTTEQSRNLMALLHINENLAKVHILGDALKQLWTYTYWGWAQKCFDRWVIWT